MNHENLLLILLHVKTSYYFSTLLPVRRTPLYTRASVKYRQAKHNNCMTVPNTE